MTSKTTTKVLRAIAFLVASLFLVWCTGAFSARELAAAMASGHDEWFDVDGGEEVNEEPPEEDTDGQPALLSFDAPMDIGPDRTVDFDTPFTVTVNYDPAYEDNIAYVIFHVLQANKDDEAPSYIRVPFTGTGGSQVLNVQFNQAANLPGNAFAIQLGLQMRADELVTNYMSWNVVTIPDTGETTVVPLCEAIPYSSSGSLYENSDTGELEYYPPMLSNVVFLGNCSLPEETYSVWTDSLQGNNTRMAPWDLLYPSGTRWLYYDSMSGTIQPDCQLELRCGVSSSSNVPFNMKDFQHSY